VNYAVKSIRLEDLGQCRIIANVRLDKIKVWIFKIRFDGGSFDRGIIKIVKVVNNGYSPTTFRQEMPDQMRADEAGPAGN
jgi:hypothetical protein